MSDFECVPVDSGGGSCLVCSRPAPRYKSSGLPKRFCSEKCRKDHGREKSRDRARHLAAVRQKPAPIILTCAMCSASFTYRWPCQKSSVCPSCAPAARRAAKRRYDKRARDARRLAVGPKIKVKDTDKRCPICQKTFRHPSRMQKTCGLDCGHKLMRQTVALANLGKLRSKRSRDCAVRRGRIAAATLEKFRPIEVFERDGWTCGICCEPVDPSLVLPDKISASLDHIIPIARGGLHTKRNTQCSHWICNSRKSDGRAGGFYIEVTHGEAWKASISGNASAAP